MAILTVSDLRWMEERRRRAALRRLLQADDATLTATGLERAALRAYAESTPDASLCAEARRHPALSRRLGCPG